MTLSPTQIDFLNRYLGTSLKPEGPTPKPDETGQVSLKKLAQCKLIWTQTLKSMRGEMDKLVREILAEEDANPDNTPEDHADIRQGVTKLQSFLDPFDGRLETALQTAVDARDIETRNQRLKACRSVLNEFSEHLKTPFFQEVDKKNGYLEVAIYANAERSINDIIKQISLQE